MWENFNLTKLPACGKVFVGIFTALMVAVFIWAGTLATIESEIFGSDENEKAAAENYDYEADMETIAADSLAVTAPDWSNAGKEEPINKDDLGDFAANTEEESTWEKFEDNLKLSHVHLNGHTALYFALGVIFLFSTAGAGTKKWVFWIFGIAILVHTLGLAAIDTCPYGKVLALIGGPPLLLSILFMVFIIFADLRKK